MQLRRLTAAPLTHEAATSAAPSDGREVQLGVHATKRSNSPRRQQAGEMLTPSLPCLGRFGHVLYYFRTRTPPPRPRQVMNVKAPPAHAESALPPRQVLGRTLQPHTTPVPLQLRMPSLKNSPMASMTCRPQIENQSEEGSGQGLCLREPCRNHSRILDVNKAHSSSIQVCSQHLWLVSCDRARRLSVILGFWAPNDQGLRAATGHPLLLGEHTED